MLVAVIGIGSNSLRMLIADIKDAQLHRVFRDREGLRVFAALDENRNISNEMMDKACHSVSLFMAIAREHGADQIFLFATSAVRDAANQEAFCARLFEKTGVLPEICSGELEARLSFLGATGVERSGMIDIGGGSTEIVIGQGDRIDFSASLQLGAVRLYRQFPIACAEDARQVVDFARETLRHNAKEVLAQGPVEWVGVGGTFTTLAALVQNISWTSKERIHGFVLPGRDVLTCMNWLAELSLKHRMELNGLQPQRADIVVHGMAILTACMQELQMESVTVSEFGNLEGYLKYRFHCRG